MTTRIYSPVRVGVPVFALSVADVESLEAAAKITLDRVERAIINRTFNSYVSMQFAEWGNPRSTEAKAQFAGLQSALKQFTASWDQTFGLGSAMEFHLGAQLDRSTNRSQMLAQGIDTPNAIPDPVERDRAFNSQKWLLALRAKLEVLDSALNDARRELPTDLGGPDRPKNHYRIFVLGLADAYYSAGGHVTATWDSSEDLYVSEGFLALVHQAQRLLPSPFVFSGTAVGKRVQQCISEWRSEPRADREARLNRVRQMVESGSGCDEDALPRKSVLGQLANSLE